MAIRVSASSVGDHGAPKWRSRPGRCGGKRARSSVGRATAPPASSCLEDGTPVLESGLFKVRGSNRPGTGRRVCLRRARRRTRELGWQRSERRLGVWYATRFVRAVEMPEAVPVAADPQGLKTSSGRRSRSGGSGRGHTPTAGVAAGRCTAAVRSDTAARRRTPAVRGRTAAGAHRASACARGAPAADPPEAPPRPRRPAPRHVGRNSRCAGRRRHRGPRHVRLRQATAAICRSWSRRPGWRRSRPPRRRSRLLCPQRRRARRRRAPPSPPPRRRRPRCLQRPQASETQGPQAASAKKAAAPAVRLVTGKRWFLARVGKQSASAGGLLRRAHRRTYPQLDRRRLGWLRRGEQPDGRGQRAPVALNGTIDRVFAAPRG
jgi:hypothetical protein